MNLAKSQRTRLARLALLAILATSSFHVGGLVLISDEDPTGTETLAGLSPWESPNTLWKMAQLCVIVVVIFETYHAGTLAFILTPFLPCMAWLCLSAVANGPSMRMAASLASLLMPILFACACAQTFRSLHDLRAIQRGCLMALPVGWVVCAVFRVIRGGPIVPFTITLGLPMTLGSSAAIMTASSVAMLHYALSRDRRQILALSLLLFLLLLPTNRIAVLGAVIAVIFLLVSLLGRNAGEVVLRLLPILFIAAILNGGRLVTKTFEGREQRSTVLGIQMSGRDVVWPLYWEYAMREPVLGHGPGADSSFARDEGFGEIGAAHNDYLALLIYAGYPALVLYVGAFIVLLLRLYRVQRRSRSHRMAFVTAVAPLLFMAIAATTDHPIRNPHVMMPLVAPLAVVAGASIYGASASGKIRYTLASGRCRAPGGRAKRARPMEYRT